MLVDHIFIFSTDKGKEADELVNFGLTEGSSRIHTGQGTTNRKFYFQNFFLEILWVHDPMEVQNERTRVTRLWERSNFESNGSSPFGLCLLNTHDSDTLFRKASLYQPAYFPAGDAVEFIDDPNAPWLFRLPFRGPKKATTEPLEHPKKLKELTKVTFSTPAITDLASPIQQISEAKITFETFNKHLLTLEFDQGHSQQEYRFQELPLIIKY